MTSSTCSNPQDPKESTSHDKEPPEIEYAEGVDDLTVDFLKTRFRESHLVSLGSSIIDEDRPEYRDSCLNRLGPVIDLNLNGKGDERNDTEGKEEGLSPGRDNDENADCESIDKDEKEWYKDESDQFREEILTDSTEIVVVCILGGFLGYMFTRWFR
eukprot:scaffold44750_cov47-Cyclotella_meneghiniana.AAC.1